MAGRRLRATLRLLALFVDDKQHKMTVQLALGGCKGNMSTNHELLATYLPLLDAEYRRIGFTDDDLRYLGSGGEISGESLERALSQLRTVASGIGAQAYFAQLGVDLDAIKYEARHPSSE